MTCPCKNCLVKPLCKNKDYNTLYATCKILEKYLLFDSDETHRERVKKLERGLRSNVWYLGKRSDKGYYLMKKR